MKGTLLQTFQQVKGERENDQHGPALFVVNCPGSIANQKGLHFGVKIVVKLYVLHHVSKFTTRKLITNYMHLILGRMVQEQ